ncbi:EAL domain-containing protein [Bosea vestrisii]|uniref:EAL domain-containing protein n=1 Tax=Bosea vestrisii TaxID=151416 RepID=UPI0024E01F77|nr:EAL domain-containing protein [Bosea vestrisii]WID95532.1 EAL domain-containing protein [Bosea vestrisii]
MARIRLSALSPAASGVAGFSLGAAAILLLPGNLANAIGLLSAGLGLAGAAALARRGRTQEREQLLAAIGEVKVRLATNAIRVDTMAKRFDQLPMAEADAAPAKAMLHELTAEVGLLGDLLQQVATTLGEHDDQLSRIEGRLANPQPQPARLVAFTPERTEPRIPEPLTASRQDPTEAARLRAAEERAALISEALAKGQVEVHLQPIVSLPQRRTRGYEALVRLRLDEKTLLLPSEFLTTVEERGFGPTLDALVLTRALAIARHLGGKPGELFVACNFSAATWGSSRALAALSRILEKYHEHIGNLVIEMPQRVFRSLEPASLGLLGAMSANGVRFALDHVSDLRFDPISLHDRGVRFVKAPAALLLAEARGGKLADIAVGDLAVQLARGSIQLVAEEVEDDPMVADMLDLGIAYGQGVVFSPPRPVRPEVFAEPQPEAAQASAVPVPPPASAEVVEHPALASPPVVKRVPFRDILRRATA